MVWKMSPFAKLLRDYRIKSGLRQKELADLLGYEQSYLSALELGLKGPPNREFAGQLIRVLELDEEEQITLREPAWPKLSFPSSYRD